MTNQPKAVIGAATVAAGVLFVCLAVIARLPLVVALAVALVVGGGIVALSRQSGRAAIVADPGQVSAPVPASAAAEPQPRKYQARPVAGIPVPSAVPGFNFVFSAAVYWVPAVDGVREPERVAEAEIIRRTAEFTKQHDPRRATLVQNGLAEVLMVPRADQKQRVYARAESVALTITADDQRHLDERDRLRKQEELWDCGRRLEVNKRRYLEDDVLKSPASAVVWWLARNDDKPEKVAGQIEMLTRLARAAASTADTPADYAMGYGSTRDGDNDAMTTDSASLTTAGHFRAFLDSFEFPDGDARLLLTKQVASVVEGHGYPSVAREMTSPYDDWPSGPRLMSEDSEPVLGDS
jgi:hypothetical protein